MHMSMSLKYEPAWEPLHISVKWSHYSVLTGGHISSPFDQMFGRVLSGDEVSSSLLLSSLELSDTQVYEP